ncbi:MAG TPA: HAMP domain-containing protein, partial [Nitrospirota bacterium]|nr:HAMP domain-containing protein [Nitrospirota bacterium]
MRTSLRTKALLVVFVTLSIVLGANTFFLSWGFISFQKNSLQNKVRIIGEHLREELSRALNLGLPLDSLEGVNESCREIIEDNKEVGYCMLVGTDNRILYHNDPLVAGRFLRDEASARSAKANSVLVQPREDEGVDYYDISLPVLDTDQRLLGSIRLGLRRGAVYSQIYPLIWESTVVAVFTFLLASVLVTLFISRKVVTPIVELSRSASLIAQGDLARHLEIASGDEVGQLAASFNRMAESLKER